MAKKRVQRGFTLVELLVGLTVGLITLLVLTQLLQSFEGQKRTSTGGNDAQTNGAFALYMLDREIRMAGYGLFGPESMLCKNGINMYYDDPVGGATVLDAASFVPIRIIDGGGSAPDSVITMRSDAEFGAVPTTVIKEMTNTSSELATSSGAGLKGPDRKRDRPGDLFIMASKDGERICSLLQMTQDPQAIGGKPGGFHLQHNPGSDGPYNPSNPNNVFKDAPKYKVDDIVINMGNYPRRQYSVQCDQLVDSDPLAVAAPTCDNTRPMVAQIVNLQAQYGIAPAGSLVVNQWIDATGAWANPAGADISRVRAIRLAVVARNPQYEKSFADTGTPDKLEMWTGGPTIDIPETERHYRYRLYETIIPLRNIIWSPS
ncbi:PilW family protein [Thauera sp. 2A1]|uniref:PilW family protein n=1 Tax=Thauera sp. 2A1 TaxID=2570191 RepID=UPI0012910F6B|nr:PilW family protein [Thauera sp. 2A1]KAI5916017.1 PilW family protein [Thauera sp. 2A1]